VKAQCSLCSALISRGGHGQKASTTSLLKHLKLKHHDAFYAGTGKFPKKDEKSSADADDDTTVNDESDGNGEGKSSKSRLEKSAELPTIKNTPKGPKFKFYQFWDIEDPAIAPYHYSIAEMLALDCLPYSRVEDIGFLRLINTLQPRYEVIDRIFTIIQHLHVFF
jgi:hypothetical protein